MNNKNKTIVLLLICILLMWKTHNYYYNMQKVNPAESNELGKSDKQSKDTQQVTITVYYETLCSDSRNFVLRELLPTYLLIPRHILLDLVPYGKARTVEKPDGKVEFHCQHGEIECLGNKVHACTIELVKDPMQLLQMVACMIDDNIIPLDVAERCAKENAVNYEHIAACTNSPHSSELLKQHGIRTNKVHPTFIPTVELNGEMRVPLSVILKDLKKQVCALLNNNKPSECM